MEFKDLGRDFLKYEQHSNNPDKRRKVNLQHFREKVWPLRDKWLFISYDDAINKYGHNMTQAEVFAGKMLEAKPKEYNYLNDKEGLIKRLETGTSSECLIASIFDVPFEDSVGSSSDYHFLDIAKTFGVKASEYGHCAMIEQEPIGPQLIVLKNKKGIGKVAPGFYVCGLATVAMQMKYSTEHRLTYMSAFWKNKNKKVGFYGYEELIPVHDCLTLPKMRELIMKYEDPCWWMWTKED